MVSKTPGVGRRLARDRSVHPRRHGDYNDAKRARVVTRKEGFSASYWDSRPLKLCDFIYNSCNVYAGKPDRKAGYKAGEKSAPFKDTDIISDKFRHKKEMAPRPSKCAACNMDFSSVAELKTHNAEVHKKKPDLRRSFPARLKLKEAAATKNMVKTPIPNKRKTLSATGTPLIMEDWLERKTKSNKVGELLAEGRRVTLTPRLPETIPRSASNPGPMNEGDDVLLRETQSSPRNTSVNLLENMEGDGAAGGAAVSAAEQGVPVARTLTMYPPGYKEKLDTIDARWDSATGKVGRKDETPLKVGGETDHEKSKGGEEVQKENEKEKKRDREEEDAATEEKRKDEKETPPEQRLRVGLADMAATSRNLAATLEEVAMSTEEGENLGRETMEAANMIALVEWDAAAATAAAESASGKKEEKGCGSGSGKIDFSTFTEEDIEKLWAEGGPLSPPNTMEQGNLIDELYEQIESANEENKATAAKLQEALCDKDQMYEMISQLEDKLMIANANFDRAKSDTEALSSRHQKQIETVTAQVQTDKEKDSAEMVKLRMELKHYEAKLRRENNEAKAIRTQNADAKVEITRLFGELKEVKVKCSEGAKMLARLESVARNAQEEKEFKEKRIIELEHKMKQLSTNQPCKIRDCEGNCGSNHHCGRGRGRNFFRNDGGVPRGGSVPTVNNLASAANLSEVQMNDVINLAVPTGQFRGQVRGGGGARGQSNRGRSLDGRGRGRRSGPKRPPKGYIVEKCRWFHNPDILYCPWGSQCWNAHELTSAQEAAEGLGGPEGQNWREACPSYGAPAAAAAGPAFNPIYHPSHPVYGSQARAPASMAAPAPTQASGNEQGQSQGAAAVQNTRPQNTGASPSSNMRQGMSASLEEEARRRVQETLNQRRSDRAHVQAMEDPGWTRVMAAAEEVIRRNQPQNSEEEMDRDLA